MSILSRYVVREFFRLFLILLLGVIWIYIVVNFFETLDKFVEAKPGVQTIALYYLYQIPYLAYLMAPIAVMLAVFFSVGEMARHFEILALKALGISPFRLFRPLLFSGLLVSLLVMGATELLMPAGLVRARQIREEKIEKRKIPLRIGRNLSFFGKGNRFYFFRYIDAARNIARGIMVLEFDEKGRLRRRIDATRGSYISGAWHFSHVTERRFLEGDREIVEMHDQKAYPEIAEKPFDFLRRKKEIEELSARELWRIIREKRQARVDPTIELVEFHTRFSFPFVSFVILFLVFPLAASMRGVGRTYAFGLSLFLAFFYWGLLQTAKALGMAGKMSPFIAAWLPNGIFLLLGLIGLWRTHR